MGIFDNLFGKKGGSTPNTPNTGSNSQLNLGNPIVAKMVEWIEHPMEFNRKPETISIVASRELFCPTQRVETCYLLRFTMNDGKEYIGFTGPITWCFFGIDFSALSHEELFLLYIGWFVAFVYLNGGDYDKSQEGRNKTVVVAELEKQGYQHVQVLQNLYMAKEDYYELSATQNGTELKLVGTQGNIKEYPKTHILPFYEFIGNVWGPFDLE